MSGGKSAPATPAHSRSAVARRGFFHVGGRYTGADGQAIMNGQAYVEMLEPAEVRRPWPLVLVHGSAQTATNWMGTPDGRPGWAEHFVAAGYVVYLLEQPMRGRSAWHPDDGPTRMLTAQEIDYLFTATAALGDWPQSCMHTR